MKLITVIGDVHGRLKKLRALMKQITEQYANMYEAFVFILTGDLIDKGEESCEVLDYVRHFNEQHTAIKLYTVRGNHDDKYLRYLTSDNVILTVENIGNHYINPDRSIVPFLAELPAAIVFQHPVLKTPVIVVHGGFTLDEDFSNSPLGEELSIIPFTQANKHWMYTKHLSSEFIPHSSTQRKNVIHDRNNPEWFELYKTKELKMPSTTIICGHTAHKEIIDTRHNSTNPRYPRIINIDTLGKLTAYILNKDQFISL